MEPQAGVLTTLSLLFLHPEEDDNNNTVLLRLLGRLGENSAKQLYLLGLQTLARGLDTWTVQKAERTLD